MTKKTNAIAFRLGYNLFWFYKKLNFFFFFKFRKIVKFCKQSVDQKYWLCLNFTFLVDVIHITIYALYNRFNINKNNHNLKLKVKTKNIKKLTNSKKHYQIYFIKTADRQFFISKLKSNITRLKNHTQFFRQFTRNKKVFLKTTKRKFVFHKKVRIKYVYFFFLRYFYLQHYKTWLKLYYGLLVFDLESIENYYYYYFDLFCFNLNKHSVKIQNKDYGLKFYSSNKLALWLKKQVCLRTHQQSVIKKNKYSFISRNYTLLIKLKELRLEVLIFKTFNFKLKVYIMNALSALNIKKFLNYYEKTFFLKKNKVKKTELKRYYLLLYVYFTFKNVESICKHLGSIMIRNFRHIKSIQFLLNQFYALYFQQILSLKGFKLYISGKLNGNMRKQKYSYKIGKILLNTIDTRISYFFFPLKTKFGIFSIKVWLSY